MRRLCEEYPPFPITSHAALWSGLTCRLMRSPRANFFSVWRAYPVGRQTTPSAFCPPFPIVSWVDCISHMERTVRRRLGGTDERDRVSWNDGKAKSRLMVNDERKGIELPLIHFYHQAANCSVTKDCFLICWFRNLTDGRRCFSCFCSHINMMMVMMTCNKLI